MLVYNIYLIRKKCWNNNEYESTGNYILSNYFLKIIQELIYNKIYSSEFNNLINNLNLSDCKKPDDYIKKDINESFDHLENISKRFNMNVDNLISNINPLENAYFKELKQIYLNHHLL